MVCQVFSTSATSSNSKIFCFVDICKLTYTPLLKLTYCPAQASLGDPEHPIIIGTKKTYNDGKWHKLDAARVQRICSLRLDNEPPTKGESSGADYFIDAIDTMNFGGDNEGIEEIADKGFDGCIRQISIDRVNIDLTENKESIGVAYGCQVNSVIFTVSKPISVVTVCLHFIKSK